MSFSGDVKAELCRTKLQRRCCIQAEAFGTLLYCNQFSPQGIKIVTEGASFASRLPLLFRRAFQVELDHRAGSDSESAKQIFTVTDRKNLGQIWEGCGYEPDASPGLHINFASLEEEHCRLAFLRGAFLAGGSVTDPQKGYHLELVTSHFNVSRELTSLLLELGYSPKTTTRKSNYVTYFKQSEYIEDLLTAIGAPVSAMEIMNAKVEKNLRNGINRRVNCDAANVDKTVDAALEQLAAIRRLDSAVGLASLSDKLQEAARLRQEYPELALSQLAALCDPPVTKSCFNHRLRKLVALSHQTAKD